MKIFLRKLRVALTPRGWILKSTLASGARVFGENRDGYGGRGVYVWRDAIEPEYEHLESFLDPSGVFIDVGANTGVYTIKAAKHFGNTGVVLALEPFPDVFAQLCRSVRENGFVNVRLRNMCAGKQTISSTLWKNFGKPNSFSLHKQDTGATGISVLAVALDDLFAWEQLTRCDYLKIDAEGAEQEILDGAKNLISSHRPIIQVEGTENVFKISATNYSAFRAHNGPNIVYIPNESPRSALPAQLGWDRLPD